MELNLPEAIDKSDEVSVIDYSLLKVSQGALPQVKVITAVTGNAGVMMRYKTNLQVADVSATDHVEVFGKTKEGEIIIARQVRARN